MNAFDRLLRLYAALVFAVVFAAAHGQNGFALANCDIVYERGSIQPAGNNEIQIDCSTGPTSFNQLADARVSANAVIMTQRFNPQTK